MVEIRKVSSKKELKKFIRFNYELYKGNKYAVPDLLEDMLDTFNPKTNPALEFCETDAFLAYRDGKIVGRVAAIINKRANETWGKTTVRFGWIDFIDDTEVSEKLIDTVKEWGRERGMTEIEGPLGFTDMDPEGMLIEGFDQLGTMPTIYNYPYYQQHMERLGLQKATDWIEMKVFVPNEIPDKYSRIAKIVEQRCDLHIRELTSKKEIFKDGTVHRMFDLINDAYAPLFGYSRMTEKQIDKYASTYVKLLDLDMVAVVEDKDGNIIAVGISMPSMSEAIQKAKGKLFPFGWWHLAKALFFKKPRMLDMLLVAVRPDYQGKGVNAMLFNKLIPVYQKYGYEWAETNVILETNQKNLSQWQYLETEQHKRRRCFTQEL